MDDKAVAPIKTLDEIKKSFANSRTGFDPDYVLREGDKEMKDGNGIQLTGPETNVFKAMTLCEFDNGILLTVSLEESYKTFAIDYLRKIRAEFNCQAPSENALAELATLNFVRTLQIQQKINNYLSKGSVTDTGVRFLQVMSQELDRANRHFVNSIQVLKMMRLPQQMQVSIRAQTAVVGQNQVVQANN